MISKEKSDYLLGQKIRLLRKYKELNQTDFGKIFGLTKGFISQVENGKNTMTRDTVREAANYFGVETTTLEYPDEFKDVESLFIFDKLAKILNKPTTTPADCENIKKFLEIIKAGDSHKYYHAIMTMLNQD